MEDNIPSINPLSGKLITQKYIDQWRDASKLPIWKYKDQLLDTVRNNTFTILTAGTGAGKTRLAAKFLIPLIDELNGIMIITEPKRISAIQAANTFSNDNDVLIGEEVGYKIRFESKVSPKTKIIFETEGIALQEISNNPNLSKYAVILIDEVHERSINVDIILAMLRTINPSRTRVVLMSATIDLEKFSKYLYGAPWISVEGVPQTIETFYATEKSKDKIADAILKTIEICEGDIPGDVIVFVDGSEVAEGACRSFTELYEGAEAYCVTLYSNLTSDRQTYVKDLFKPGERKVIFSTNLAEASVTIATAVFVVDTGLHKESSYEYSTRAELLVIEFISKASANQRRGRVGRTKPGFVYRIYTQEEYNKMPDYTTPEISKGNIEDVLLKILNMLENFDSDNLEFIDPLNEKNVKDSIEFLLNQKLILKIGKGDDIFNYGLTDLGKLASQIPLTNQESKMLFTAYRYLLSDQILIIISMMGNQSLFIKLEKDKQYKIAQIWENYCTYRNRVYGDHYGLLNVFNQFSRLKPDKRFDWGNKNFIKIGNLDSVYKTYTEMKRSVERLILNC